jgi:hypothetical protein
VKFRSSDGSSIRQSGLSSTSNCETGPFFEVWRIACLLAYLTQEKNDLKN